MNTMISVDPATSQNIWVVFSGKTDLCWLKILKQGFRHCFVIVNDGKCWMSVDPMSHHTEILVHHLSPDFDLPAWLRGRNHKVVKAPDKRVINKPAPFAFFNCVEAVKRILGIHKRSIVTPWQLYQFLYLSQKKEINHG